MENRRLTAKIASIQEVISGKFIQKSGFESSYVLTGFGRKLSRIRTMGLVVDKFISEDGAFGAVTIDDSTETIRLKAFVNLGVFDSVTKGDLVDIFGKLREYNNEIYIVPEIIRKVNPNYEILRKLELRKIRNEQIDKIKKIQELQKQSADLSELKILAKNFMASEDVESILEAKDIIDKSIEKKSIEQVDNKQKILDILKDSDGLDYSLIVKKSGLEENIIDPIIQDLLESGVCFEPKAGIIKLV